MAKYSEKIMDHFNNPRNVGEIDNADGVGTIGNAHCGDIMQVFIKVFEGKIVDAKFKTFGCGAAIATTSMITEQIKDKTVSEALKIAGEIIAEASEEMPSGKKPCALLAGDALKAAVYEYQCKAGGKGVSPGK